MPPNLPMELLTVQNLNRVACRVFNQTGLLAMGMIPDEAVLYDAVAERLTDTDITREQRREPCPQDSLRWIVRDAYALFYDNGGHRDAPISQNPDIMREAAECLICWTDYPDTVSYSDLRGKYSSLTRQAVPERVDPLIWMLYVVVIHHKDHQSTFLSMPAGRNWKNPTYGVVQTMYQDTALIDQVFGRQMSINTAMQTNAVQLGMLRCTLYRLLAGYLP